MMDDPYRMARILAEIAPSVRPAPTTLPQRICAAGVLALGTGGGAGLTLMMNSQHGGHWASDNLATLVDDAQLGLGEGPGLEAFRRGVPVFEPSLEAPSTRWPFFRAAAMAIGVQAVFAFPLQVGVIRLGVLTLHREDQGALDDDELADILVLVDLATQSILDLQATGSVYWRLFDPLGDRARLHQATGMIATQINSDIATALAYIRSYAFANERTVHQIADDVIAQRLRLNRRSPG